MSLRDAMWMDQVPVFAEQLYTWEKTLEYYEPPTDRQMELLRCRTCMEPYYREHWDNATQINAAVESPVHPPELEDGESCDHEYDDDADALLMEAVAGVEVYQEALQQLLRILPDHLAQAGLYVAHHELPSTSVPSGSMPSAEVCRMYMSGRMLNDYLGMVSRLSELDRSVRGTAGPWSCSESEDVCSRCRAMAMARGRNRARFLRQSMLYDGGDEVEEPTACMDRRSVALVEGDLQHGLRVVATLLEAYMEGANEYLEEYGAERVPRLTMEEATAMAPRIVHFWVCRSVEKLSTSPFFDKLK